MDPIDLAARSSTRATQRPLRILVAADVPPDPNSGAAGTVWQMNRALERLGHQVDEIWADDLGRRRVCHGNLHYLLELPRAYRSAVAERCRRAEYDVIELNQPHAYLAAMHHKKSRRQGLFVNRSHGHEVRVDLTLPAFRRQYEPVVRASIRGGMSALIRRMLWRQWRLMASLADGFVVSCTEDRDFLCQRYAVETMRIGVISQGVPDAFLSTSIKPLSPARLLRMLHVGQMAFFKAPMLVGNIAANWLRRNPQRTMTWVCDKQHHEQAQAYLPADVRSRVCFAGHVSQTELIDVYDSHGVFVFPSFFEGFGKAPLEAMSRGLCVAASNVGGMRDFITPGVDGLLAPVGDPIQMTEQLEQLMRDPDACARMAKAAVRTASRHTWDWCARECTAFYRSLSQRPQARTNQVKGPPATR